MKNWEEKIKTDMKINTKNCWEGSHTIRQDLSQQNYAFAKGSFQDCNMQMLG